MGGELISEVERMQSLFPKCPICDSEKGYKFSTFYPLVACKACKSEWALYEEEMELKSTCALGLTTGLLNKRYSFDFWKNFEVEGEPKQTMKGNSNALVETLRSFQRKLEKLKKEKTDLHTEIEKIRKIGQEKIRMKEEETTALEEEVAKLKKELESLKELIGSLE